MSDEDDIAFDAMQEEAYEAMYKSFRRDHEHDITDEITTGEVLSAIAAAHRDWWDRTEAELTKAHRRIDDQEPDEALFHVARAFDGYIQNVLVAPLKGALVERFDRFMPEGFPIKEGNIFKSVSGLVDATVFCSYSLALVVKRVDDATVMIEAMHKLINGDKNKKDDPTWRERNRAFHAPIEVAPKTAELLLHAAESILLEIVRHVKIRVDEDNAARECREFSPARMQILRQLSEVFDISANSLVPDHEMPLSYDASEGRSETLRELAMLGYIERCEIEDPNFPFLRHQWLYRLTQQGREYYEEKVTPRIAPFGLK